MGQPTLNVSEEGRPPERYAGAVVSANLFRLIGEKPFLGPGFTDDDDRFGAPPRVVIGYGMWQTRYGGDPDMIGRTIKVDDLHRHRRRRDAGRHACFRPTPTSGCRWDSRRWSRARRGSCATTR